MKVVEDKSKNGWGDGGGGDRMVGLIFTVEEET